MEKRTQLWGHTAGNWISLAPTIMLLPIHS